ncbi:hypothetical protein M3N55_02350 [Roseibaca sp. V10]|uniref:Uncharacterized protein n=1 Tax=Roseinatronobacter domitianus TaxID=2940293 RepID=A0ABT0LY99_9RHOB|nr:hypothetical protein [Roseibaca domitiana]MCL1627561.1 hypothetical protein [Roseibaca domitiana]
MSDIRNEIRTHVAQAQFDPTIKAEIEDALRVDTRNGAPVAQILDNAALSNAEKASELGALAITGPGGIRGAIAIGIIIGILL